jgi:hypothetical protein
VLINQETLRHQVGVNSQILYKGCSQNSPEV